MLPFLMMHIHTKYTKSTTGRALLGFVSLYNYNKNGTECEYVVVYPHCFKIQKSAIIWGKGTVFKE